MIENLKKRMVSKTYLSALVLGLVTAVDMNTQVLSGLLPEQYRPYLLMIWPVTMMTLREMTKGALGDEKDAP